MPARIVVPLRGEGRRCGLHPARGAGAGSSPRVCAALGRCGEAAARSIRRLARRSAEDRALSVKSEVQRWFSMLSLRLALDQAEILTQS